jgi:hypothetical protein
MPRRFSLSFCNDNEATSQRPPPPRFAWSPSPTSWGHKRNRSRGAFRARVFAMSVARIVRSAIRGWRFSFKRHSRISLRSIRATKKKGKRNADKRHNHPPRRATRRAPCKARPPVGVPPRLSPKGLLIPKAQRQAMLPGTWPERSIRYGRPNRGAETSRCSTGVTRAACPSPASTSRAGHSAGRHDAQAARERSVWLRPRAPHPLHLG